MSTTQNLNFAAIEGLIAQCVADALAAYEANINSGDGAAGGGENTTRGRKYKEFLICKPLNFNGTEGALGLTRWFEKMESAFHMCECAENCKVKYATSTLLDAAFTWWNFYAQSIGIDAAYQTSWNDLKKVMTEMYCPRYELQRMEIRDMPTTTQNLSSPAIERLIFQRVADALTAYKANKNSGDRVGTSDVAGGGENTTRGCSYKEFLKCKPRNFNGTEGALGLIGWFGKMESVFRICECAENCKVLYATGTLRDAALTWWNFYARSKENDVAYQTSWNDLKKMMTEMYCPRYELRRMELEFWNLSVKGTDIVAYTNRFQELALLCPTMVTPESKKIERYIEGLTPDIEGKVASSNPTTIHSAISMAHALMDQVVRVKVARNADDKMKWDDNQKGNSGQQQNKRRKVVRAYAVGTGDIGTGDKKGYAGTLPKCNKCQFHHNGPCHAQCGNCKKVGNQASDYRVPTPMTNRKITVTCFECGVKGHFRSDCPKLKNQNSERARASAYVFGEGEARQDPNVVTGGKTSSSVNKTSKEDSRVLMNL